MIKKILIIILSIALLFNQTFAECKIEDWPPDIFKDYFSSVRKVISNVANEASSKYIPKSPEWFKRDYIETTNSLAWMWNDISNWGFYNSSFEFYVVYPLSSEIPPQIMRDNNLIEKEIKNISEFTKKLVESWYWNIELTNVCSWVTNCNLKWTTIDILWKLLESTSDLWELYRLSILDQKYTFSWDIILVPKNFKEEFSNYYNVYTTTECSNIEGGYKERISKAFNNIVKNFKSWSDGIWKWEEAIALLNENSDFMWNKDDEMRLLRKELWRQWVSLDNTAAILGNLEEYHSNWWFSWDNNFIANSYDSVKRASKEVYDTFDRLSTEFTSVFNQWSLWWVKKETSIKNLANIDIKLKTSEEIWLEILEKFNAEKDFALNQDITNSSVKWRILNLHFQITQSISTLVKVIPVSEKVCNKQVTWKWKCSYK